LFLLVLHKKTAFRRSVAQIRLELAPLSKLSENQRDRLLIEPPTFLQPLEFTGDIVSEGSFQYWAGWLQICFSFTSRAKIMTVLELIQSAKDSTPQAACSVR